MGTLFGTDGIRGTVGIFPFTQNDVFRLGNAIGAWLVATYKKDAQLLLAHDTRHSADWLSSTLCSGILQHPITIHTAGILPTPAISHLLKTEPLFDCGIILSASHNPYQDNGIKVVDRKLGKLSSQQEEIISHFFHQRPKCDYGQFGRLAHHANAAEIYHEEILRTFSSLSLAGKKIVLDCAHGATFNLAPRIFKALGADVFTIHASPNGTNINDKSGALYTAPLQKAVVEQNADYGCAFDGDGDRVILVNQAGIVKDGDDILALLTDHPRYQEQQTIVSTVMSNYGLEAFLKSKGKQLLRTQVGDRWVAQELTNLNLLLGGEQSGHVIVRDILPTGDGITTALRVLEASLESGNSSLETFNRYPQYLINVPVSEKRDLKEPALAAIILEYEQQLYSGRVHVRYSGTENLLRIMVEDAKEQNASIICTHLASALKQALQ